MVYRKVGFCSLEVNIKAMIVLHGDPKDFPSNMFQSCDTVLDFPTGFWKISFSGWILYFLIDSEHCNCF